VRTASGVTSSFGRDVPFTDELVVSLPDRMRLAIVSGGTQKTRVVQVVNGDKGWVLAGGMVSEMGKDRLAEMRRKCICCGADAGALKATPSSRTPLPEEARRRAVGAKVTAKDTQTSGCTSIARRRCW
jgi:hypothetical protein